MSRKFKLRPLESEGGSTHEKSGAIDRREFMRMSFNTAAVSYTHLTLPTKA